MQRGREWQNWDRRGGGKKYLFPTALLLRLDNLLDDLGLLYQECPKDPRLDTVPTPRTTVGPPHSLPRLGDGSILARSQGRNSGKSNSAVATLRGRGKFSDVVVDELSSWCLHDAPSVGGGVVWLAFAKCNTLGHRVIQWTGLGTVWLGVVDWEWS